MKLAVRKFSNMLRHAEKLDANRSSKVQRKQTILGEI